MYYSHSYQDEVFSFFISFLNNSIAGDKKYQSLVDPIINEAHQLAVGEKNYYSIDRNAYQIITFLVEANKDFFAKLNANELKESDYKTILEIASSQKEIHFA